MTNIAHNLESPTSLNRHRLLPALQALAWAVGCSVFFFLVYGSTNWVASTYSELPSIAFEWERFIPFVPAMIVPYVSIDLLFFASFFLLRDAHALRRHARRIVFVIAFAGVCFLLFPLQMSAQRPVVEGWWAPLFAPLHALDHPHNLVPSLHCALAAVLLPAYVARARGWLRLVVHAWFALIAASTLLTYQHHAIDVITGFALGILVLWLFPDPFTTAPRARRLDLAARYATAAAALSILAIVLGPIGWLLFWPALSCAIVGLAYAGFGAAVFRKCDGSLPFATRAILLPYLLAARVTHRFYARNLQPAVEVAPGLFIGGRCATDVDCTAILDLAAECNGPCGRNGHAYLSIPILDLTPPTPEQLGQAVRFIRAHASNGPVLVRCALGLSRSACVAAAWLIDENPELSVADAVARVRAKRPEAVINDDMLASLHAFADARRAPFIPPARSARARPRRAAALRAR